METLATIIGIITVLTDIIAWLVRTIETFQKFWQYFSRFIPFLRNRTTIPVKLGWQREKVYKKIGRPQETTSLFDVFYSYGVDLPPFLIPLIMLDFPVFPGSGSGRRA